MQEGYGAEVIMRLIRRFEVADIQIELLTRAVAGLAGGADPRSREIAAKLVEQAMETPWPTLIETPEVKAIVHADAQKLVTALAETIRTADERASPPEKKGKPRPHLYLVR